MKIVAHIVVGASLFFASSLKAQINLDSFKPGYLITQEGDTLKGLFKQGNFMMKFRPFQRAKMQKFEYSALAGYMWYEDSIQYHNLSDGFYALIVNGPIRLYKKAVQVAAYNGQYTTYHTNFHYAVVEDSREPITKLRVTGSLDMGKAYFRRTAAEYFGDCQEIVDDIEQGVYNKARTIEDLVQRYNVWLMAN